MASEKSATLYEKVEKLIGVISTDIVSVDTGKQTHNVKIETLCDRYETAPDSVILDGLTAREVMGLAVKSLMALKSPQVLGALLSGYTGLNETPVVHLDGYTLMPGKEAFCETVKQIVDDVKITDGRGRKKSAEKVITEI